MSKTIENLPHLLVTTIKRGEIDATGYAGYELSGVFDTLEGVRGGRCWLLLSDRNCLIGDLTLIDKDARAAVFVTSRCETIQPEVLHSRLPYLDGFWQAYHVWMVTEPEWRWQRMTFKPEDATGRTPLQEPGVGESRRGDQNQFIEVD